jgi:hypothetical protein
MPPPPDRTCWLCGEPAGVERHRRTVLVSCPQHGRFEVARDLWDRLPRLSPVERQRGFFQLEGGTRRVWRLPR